MSKSKNRDFKIGKKLQEVRITNGYTQEQVAELLNCSVRYISHLETNQSSGSISFLISLCNLYNITLNDLYDEYINTSTDLKDNLSFAGYISLNKEHKSTVDCLITHLNTIEKSKK